jgi:outer membrane protein OmpA-like peptidoglycan-associated protein
MRINLMNRPIPLAVRALSLAKNGVMIILVTAILFFPGIYAKTAPQVRHDVIRQPVLEIPFQRRVSDAISTLGDVSQLVESVQSAGTNEVLITLRSDQLFSVDKVRVEAAGKTWLMGIASALTPVRGLARVEVEGHTDRSPVIKHKQLYESNWELSSLRASRIIPILALGGMRTDILSAVGYGDSRPDDRFKESPELNRRIVLRVSGEKL